MSRDKGGDGIQEVVGSIPISSTNQVNDLEPPSGGSRRFCGVLTSNLDSNRQRCAAFERLIVELSTSRSPPVSTPDMR